MSASTAIFKEESKMIINRQGAKFEYEGVTHTIGGAIVGTAESEYEGLYGRINAIHDGDDKETENP